MVHFTWNECAVPDNVEIKQVYGVVFSEDGRIMLRIEDNRYKLTGGKPEKNESYEETLKREYREELNIELDDIHYLGYLFVEENNRKPYAQVRMIGKIKKVYENRPDTDTGRQYQRFLARMNNTKKYLGYKDKAGNLAIDAAIVLANQKYKFEMVSDTENLI